MKSTLHKRRTFLKLSGWTACVGLSAFFVQKQKENSFGEPLLRPPGARNESEFLSACIRCGLCVQSCPGDVLKLAGYNSGFAKGTPFLIPEETPCDLCFGRDEMECILSCPTTALKKTSDRKNVKMGLAIINKQTCLPYLGASCKACWHACPFPHDAISFNKRGRPIVIEKGCVGCGLCEFACLAEEPAITITPIDQIRKQQKSKCANESEKI